MCNFFDIHNIPNVYKEFFLLMKLIYENYDKFLDLIFYKKKIN